MNDHDDSSQMIDPFRTADLDDVGLNGYFAATVITPEGDEVLVLVCVDLLGTPAPPANRDWSVEAPHERLGKLPREFAPKCAHRRTPRSRQCRNVVTTPGDLCSSHRQSEA